MSTGLTFISLGLRQLRFHIHIGKLGWDNHNFWHARQLQFFLSVAVLGAPAALLPCMTRLPAAAYLIPSLMIVTATSLNSSTSNSSSYRMILPYDRPCIPITRTLRSLANTSSTRATHQPKPTLPLTQLRQERPPHTTTVVAWLLFPRGSAAHPALPTLISRNAPVIKNIKQPW